MPKRNITELLRRTLVIVAHPDDEAVGAGGLMQRIPDLQLVFCTDGGPLDPWFWKYFGSRENFVSVRRREAEKVAEIGGWPAPKFLPICDQELYLNLRTAIEGLEMLVSDFQPAALLTQAYEGGHPDHDSCAFLTHILSLRTNLPAWEMPLYHRTGDGGRFQEFISDHEESFPLELNARELHAKRRMIEAYPSQKLTLASFNLNVERFRPLARYDFFRPPEVEIINYEAWQWPVKATQVSDEFARVWNEVMGNTPRRKVAL